MAKGVWIVAEQRDGAFRKISYELASTARKLADQLGEEVCAALCGAGTEGTARHVGTECTDVKIADAHLLAVRPMYAGKCFGEITISSFPQMATLRPNVFPAVENAKAGTVVKFDPALAAGQLKTKILEVQKDTGGKVDLTEANIIVSGGRGMKGPENQIIIENIGGVP